MAALEEMLSVLPKHKGTDKLRGDLRKRLSKLRTDGDKSASKGGPSYSVPSEGAGQIFLVGPPNSGKSALLNVMTNASPVVAPYPFSTRLPGPGMMQYEDIFIQLVDMPPISATHTEPWISSVVRNGDLLLVVLDPLSPDVVDEVEEVLVRLEKSRLLLAGFDYPLEEIPFGALDIHTILVATKMDLPDADIGVELFAEEFGERFEILEVSAETGLGLEEFRNRMFEVLNVIRVYTKLPGKAPDMKAPFILPSGAILEDLALMVHKDIAAKLKFARAWGKNKHEGQRIGREFELVDGDIVELH